MCPSFGSISTPADVPHFRPAGSSPQLRVTFGAGLGSPSPVMGFATFPCANSVFALFRVSSEAAMMSSVVDIPTLVLYGPDDHVVDPMFVHCCEVAFTNRIGPVVVPGAGHFLQWERADILNPLLTHFFADHRSEWFA